MLLLKAVSIFGRNYQSVKTLQFKFKRNYPITPILPITISDQELNEFKARVNKLHEKFIDEINADGGYIELLMTNDGLHIDRDTLCCSQKLMDKIQSSHLP